MLIWEWAFVAVHTSNDFGFICITKFLWTINLIVTKYFKSTWNQSDRYQKRCAILNCLMPKSPNRPSIHKLSTLITFNSIYCISKRITCCFFSIRFRIYFVIPLSSNIYDTNIAVKDAWTTLFGMPSDPCGWWGRTELVRRHFKCALNMPSL